MRKFLLILCCLCFLPLSARAQTQTNVTATITDPIGIPYAFGTYSIQLIPSGTNPTVNGNAIGGAFNGSTDANGSFNVALWPNASISPGGTQWQVTVCVSPGVQPPLGTGGQCSTPPLVVTISGASQSLSAALSAVAPKLTTITIGSGTVTNIATTAPITGGPITTTGTIACPTCQTSSSTVPINNVVSATGPIATIADGNNPLVINCALTSGTTCLTTGETTAATTSGAVEHQITTLTTSTAIPLQITQGAAGSATNNAPAVIKVSAAATGGAPGASQTGTTGAPIILLTGAGTAGGATTGQGGAGGAYNFTAGGGGAGGGTTTNNGGIGGEFDLSGGAGGNASATGTGGNAGFFKFIGSAGGRGGATSGSGGVGGDFLVIAGNGGVATAGSTTGRGGNVSLTLGAAGGTGTAGAPGQVLIIGKIVGAANTTPALNITTTWNTTGVVDAGILLNVTNTASGAASKLMDLQIGGTSQFNVDKTGIVTGLGTHISGTDNSAAGNFQAANSAANAHTSWGSAATTSNTVQGPATTPVTGNLVSCTSSGTTCVLTDSGVAASSLTSAKGIVTATYTNGTTGQTAITGLSVPLAANTNYAIHCALIWQQSALGSLIVSSTGPAAPTKVTAESNGAANPGAGAGFFQATDGTTFGFSLTVGIAGTTAADLYASVEIGVLNGANAGTFQLTAASTAGATLTIQPGSFCTAQ